MYGARKLVSVLVQGLINRFPKAAGDYELIRNAISIIRVGPYLVDIVVHVKSYGDAAFWSEEDGWHVKTSIEGRYRAQKELVSDEEALRRASIFFSPTFPVTHVDDRSIAIADALLKAA